MWSETSCETPRVSTLPLEGYRTPPSYEIHSQNPYDYIPPPPPRCGVIADANSSTDDRAFSKRMFLDLDNSDIPMFPAPRFGSNDNDMRYSNKRFKARPSFFSELEASLPSTPIVSVPLLRRRNAIAFQRLRQERDSAKEIDDAADTTQIQTPPATAASPPPPPPTISLSQMPSSPMTLDVSDSQAILHSALHLTSAFSSVGKSSRNICSTGETTNLKPRLSLSGVPLGREVRRRESGIARCA